MTIRPSIAAIFCLPLMACATTYKAPAADESAATITFEKGYLDGVGFGTSSSQQYNMMSDDGCNEPQLMANLLWTSGKQKEKRIAAGDKVILMAANVNYSTTGVSSTGYGYYAHMDQAICQSRVTFTPVAGQSYFMKLVEKSDNVCLLEFRNTTTGEVPEDAVIEDSFACTPPE